MGWGLALVAVPVIIAWRRPTVDGRALILLFLALAVVLGYTYRTLGA